MATRSRTRINYEKIALEYIQTLKGKPPQHRTILAVATELAGHSGFPLFKKYELAIRKLAFKGKLVLGDEDSETNPNACWREVLSMPEAA